MKDKTVDLSRRQLLKGAAVTSTVGAVAAVTGVAMANTPSTSSDEANIPDNKQYHETQHIRDYYDSL